MEQSAFGRLIGVFTSPGRTFESISRRPNWVLPLLVMVGIALTATLIITPRMDIGAMVQKGIEQSGRDVPPAQLDKIVGVYEKFKWPIALGSALIIQPAIWVLCALVFWVAFKLAGSDIGFDGSFSVTLHSFLPQGLLGLLSIPVALSYSSIGFEQVKSGSFLKSNPAAFAPEGTGPVLLSLLSSLDVFTIWTVILLCIGTRIVAKVKRGTATGIVVGSWLAVVLIKLGFAALQGMHAK